jgi:hypothetical protein
MKRQSQRVRAKGPKPHEPKINVVVGVPLGRNVSASAFLNFWEIARRGWPLIHRPYSRTDVNRNEFGRALLASDYTHLVMLDLDHRHPYDIVERLASIVQYDRDKFQVVGALAFRRGKPYNPCAYQLDGDGELRDVIEWTPGMLKVDAIGHAAMIIDRRVLEKTPAPWWQYEYWEWSDEYDYPTEDLFFCRLCREHDIDIWCDTTLITPHLAETDIDQEVFQRYMIANPPQYIIEDGQRIPYKNGKPLGAQVLEPIGEAT